MHQSQPSAANQSQSPLVGNSKHHAPVFTRKRVSLIVAGAFLILASVAALYAIGNTPNNTKKTKELDLQSTSKVSSPDKGMAVPDVSASGTEPPPSGNSHSTQVSVNGQNVPVSTNGSTSQTIDNGNSKTTVNVSNSSSSTQSSSGASSSNNFNVNVNSSSN